MYRIICYIFIKRKDKKDALFHMAHSDFIAINGAFSYADKSLFTKRGCACFLFFSSCIEKMAMHLLYF